MEIRWSPAAVADLEEIRAYIEQDSPDAAIRVIRTIYDGCLRLIDFPYMGRKSRKAGRRELPFPPLPYLALYRLHKDRVEILRIYHTSQDWLDIPRHPQP